MEALSESDEKQQQHWTNDIVDAVNFSYKGLNVQATTQVAIATATLASLVGLARYDAPYYGYLLACGTGVIFGSLVRKRWQRRKESG